MSTDLASSQKKIDHFTRLTHTCSSQNFKTSFTYATFIHKFLNMVFKEDKGNIITIKTHLRCKFNILLSVLSIKVCLKYLIVKDTRITSHIIRICTLRTKMRKPRSSVYIIDMGPPRLSSLIKNRMAWVNKRFCFNRTRLIIQRLRNRSFRPRSNSFFINLYILFKIPWGHDAEIFSRSTTLDADLHEPASDKPGSESAINLSSAANLASSIRNLASASASASLTLASASALALDFSKSQIARTLARLHSNSIRRVAELLLDELVLPNKACGTLSEALTSTSSSSRADGPTKRDSRSLKLLHKFS